MNSRLLPYTRMIALVASLSLIGVLFLPLWRIDLTAPQYPEGLVLKIHANKLSGDVAIINGLNHYIGMRTLHEKDFVEFKVLPYIIGTLVLFGLLSVMVNRRWFFLAWTGFYIAFAIVAMMDFYRWEYNYGHNLDPSAPIQVPGMAYQPPLIGFKQLLNFGAYSFPDAGGYIFIGVALLLLSGSFFEIRKYRHTHKLIQSIKTAAVVSLIFILDGCANGPQPIRFGSDLCEFCKMGISDRRFGGELITQKGKLYKFDDIHCMTAYLNSGIIEKNEVKGFYVIDFSMPGELIKAPESYLFKSDELRSPMGGNIAAFGEADSMNKYKQQFNGTATRWNELVK